MPEKQVFIVVSTGQNVANLPPVLECANAGDCVLWIESDEARQKNWSAGSRGVLERQGLLNHRDAVEIDDINDPVQVAERLRPALAGFGAGHVFNLVANGGPKLTPIGMLNACRGLPSRLLYGNPQPAELWIFDGGMERAPEKRPYTRHRLDLPDILAAGHLVPLASAPLPLDGAPIAIPPGYGRDAESTGRIHAQYHRYYQPATDSQALEARFGEIQALLQNGELRADAYDTWLKALVPLFQSGFSQGINQPGSPVPSGADIAKAWRAKPRFIAALYYATGKFAKTAARAKAKAGANFDAPDLGQVFEQAVAARLLAHLQASPGLKGVIQSVWKNVKIAQAASPQTVAAEWDIVIVLTSGIVLSIECKSFSVEQKDWDARLLNLLRAGSQAKMLICGPLYTGFAAEPWFAAMHTLKERVGKDFLPFTLPGQAEEYAVAGGRGGKRHYACPSFESALDRALAGYVPRPAGA
jgi:hypothetical protein